LRDKLAAGGGKKNFLFKLTGVCCMQACAEIRRQCCDPEFTITKYHNAAGFSDDAAAQAQDELPGHYLSLTKNTSQIIMVGTSRLLKYPCIIGFGKRASWKNISLAIPGLSYDRAVASPRGNRNSFFCVGIHSAYL
jgi:hypothetical protein